MQNEERGKKHIIILEGMVRLRTNPRASWSWQAPDFSIRNIAFEVRSLNENFVHEDGTVEGLEQLDHRLMRAMTNELEKIPFSAHLGSFAFMLRYSRKRKLMPAKLAQGLAKKRVFIIRTD